VVSIQAFAVKCNLCRYVVVYILKWTIGIRVNVDEEMKGIDASQHGGRSYTEFQTTVFKVGGCTSRVQLWVSYGVGILFNP
jgi:ammonia channel protein AmtB